MVADPYAGFFHIDLGRHVLVRQPDQLITLDLDNAVFVRQGGPDENEARTAQRTRQTWFGFM